MSKEKIVFALCCTLIANGMFALPMNPVIHEGNVAVRYEDNLAEIDAGAFAEIHWDDFSIRTDETVRFLQPNSAAVAINKVLSSHPSALFGKLEAVGQIVLINPNGIVVGRDAIIDTGALTASTFDLFSGSRRSLINEGVIRARTGDVVMLSESIDNRGSIFAYHSILMSAGGESPSLKEGGIQNTGSMIAMGPNARIFLEAPGLAIVNDGTLIAKNDSGVGGEIRLLGGVNHLYEHSLIDVSGRLGGGTVLVGGDYKGQNSAIPNSKHTWVAEGASILAGATEAGNGGRVILWGNESTYFRGAIEACGGALSGDGGFIEISSKGMLDTGGHVDLGAPNGTRGMLFLDPTVVVISDAANAGISAFPPPGYTFSASPANISDMLATTLQSYLAAGDVTIDASASGPAGVGSITFNSSGDAPMGSGITWAAPTKLTLIADGFITIRNLIYNSNMATPASTVLVDVTAPTVTIGDPATAVLGNNGAIIVDSGRVHVQAATALNLYSNTTSAEGGIRAGLTAGDAIIAPASILIENTGALEINTLNAGGLRTSIGASGDIEVHASGDILLTASGADATISTWGGGDLTVFGGGDLTLSGGTGAGLCRALVHGFLGGDVLTQITGNYSVQAGASPGGSDGSAGISFQSAAGSLSVSGADFLLESGTSPVGGTNVAIIGAVIGGSGPTTATATGSITVNALGSAAGGFQFAIFGSFFGGSSGDLTINTTDLFINGSTTPLVMTGQALAATNGNLTVNAMGDVMIAGGSGAMSNGAAILAFTPGSLVSVTANNVQVLGGSSAGSFAGIQSLNGPTTVVLTGDCLVQGGAGAGAFAGITAVPTAGTGDLNISGGNFTIIGGSGSGAAAAIAAGDPAMMAGGSGSLFLTSTGASGITITGGTGTEAFVAGLGAPVSNVSIQTTHLTVNGSVVPASMDGHAYVTANGDISIDATGNITLAGGSGVSDNSAFIYATASGASVDVTAGNVQLTGGSTADSFATLQAASGPLTAAITGDFTLQGGTGDTCYASIGTGDPNLGAAIGTGNLTLSGGNYSLVGGSAMGAVAFIGTGDPLSMMPGGDGNVALTSTGASGIVLTGGTSTQATISTRGSPLADMTIQTTHLTVNGSTVPASSGGGALVEANGNLTIDATGNITLTGGAGTAGNNAWIASYPIGTFVHVTAANVQLTGGSSTSSSALMIAVGGPLTATITGDFLLQAGSAFDTPAGIAAAPFAGTGDLTLTGQNFTLVSGTGMGALAALIAGQPGGGGGDGSIFITSTGSTGISLTGNSGVGSPALIGTFGALSTNTITIIGTHPAGNLNLTSGSGSEATISTLGGAIDIQIGHDINLTSMPGNTATIAIGALGTSDLTIQAGHSASIQSSIVNLGTGNIYFVVDAAFPAPPLFGTGGLNLGPGAFFQTAGGAIRIFTSQPAFNTIDGSFIDAFLVSHTFTAGPLFVDSNQEIWCTYYPSNFGGFPFTIFYKLCLQQLTAQAALVVNESLVDLHPYNEFPGWWQRFTMTFRESIYEVTTTHFITNRVLGSIWLPKTYTTYLHDILED